MKEKKLEQVTWFAAGSAMTMMGFMMISVFKQSHKKKIIRRLMEKDKIDFDVVKAEIRLFYQENKEDK